MATYKLIQDIEAEDHILGPLTLRQFLFALGAAAMFWLCFVAITRNAPWLLTIFLPPALFCAFFAIPFGGDQPTELWALAKLRFWFKPRKRVWDQSGVKELVTITVPKKVEHIYTDGLSQREVKSRLQVLANTIDSRGWAIKHVDALGHMPAQAVNFKSDRLIDLDNFPRDVPNYDAPEDVLDTDNSAVGQQFKSLIDRSSQERREQLMAQLNGSAPAGPSLDQQWFMNHNPATPSPAPAVDYTASSATPDDPALSSQIKARANQERQAYGNLRTLKPLGSAAQSSANTGPAGASSAVTAMNDPAILSLSNNDDLNVATIAREADKAKRGDDREQGEVVVPLH